MDWKRRVIERGSEHFLRKCEILYATSSLEEFLAYATLRLRRLRRRGASHWSYDPNEVIALRQHILFARYFRRYSHGRRTHL